MADNLVKRLRNVQFWQAECDVRMQAAARIEELEAKLANAIEALQLADAAMSGANMNMSVVERKVKATIARSKDSSHE